MGKLSPGISYATNEYLTLAKLYALIDTAVAAADAYPGTPTLFDIVMGDLDTVRAIGTVAAPASPATNDLTVGADGQLDRYDGAAWADLAVDFVYEINNTLITLVTGTPVVLDPSASGNCMIWTTGGVCYEPFGVSGTVCNPGATAKVFTQGLQFVRINNPLATPTDSHLRIAAANATCLSLTTSVQSDVLAIVVTTDTVNPLSGVCLALLVH